MHAVGLRLRHDGDLRQARLPPRPPLSTLLTLRFAIGAAALWVRGVGGEAAAATPRGRARRHRASARSATPAQAACYFSALRHIDASLTALLLCTVSGVRLPGRGGARARPAATAVRGVALALAGGGTALVLLGGGAGALNATGVALAVGASLTYTAYILVADTVVGESDPLSLAATVATSAFASLLLFSIVTGRLDLTLDAGGWASMVSLSVVSTAGAITAFLLGLQLVGPSTASIVSTIEPVVTVSLAALVFSERLGPVQLVGGGVRHLRRDRAAAATRARRARGGARSCDGRRGRAVGFVTGPGD